MTKCRKTPERDLPRPGNPLARLFVGVDGSSLAFLRIGFGLVMHWRCGATPATTGSVSSGQRSISASPEGMPSPAHPYTSGMTTTKEGPI